MNERLITTPPKEKVATLDRTRIKNLEELRSNLRPRERILYHGGLAPETTLEQIDLERLGTQQNKRERSYGGFYLDDESSRKRAERYASMRNGILHGFVISAEARMLDTGVMIDRLSEKERREYAKSYDVIKGKDVLGKSQYVLLNKGVIREMGADQIIQK